MAVKNGSLDKEISQSALQEFLKYGYEKASLRKIAAGANVTVGAIYTRYPTKDALFCSLVQPLVDQISQAFSGLRTACNMDLHSPSALMGAMWGEASTILRLMFSDYSRTVLLLCRSAGSSLENFSQIIMERKIREATEFFSKSNIQRLDENVLRMLLKSQFQMYFQIVSEGFSLPEAKKMVDAAITYHTGGWMSLLGFSREH